MPTRDTNLLCRCLDGWRQLAGNRRHYSNTVSHQRAASAGLGLESSTEDLFILTHFFRSLARFGRVGTHKIYSINKL